MAKGTGRFLDRKNSTITTGGQSLVRLILHPGDLITSRKLPDTGIYEVEKVSPECKQPGCELQDVQVRRVDMRYLTKQQKQSVQDASPKFRNSLYLVL